MKVALVHYWWVNNRGGESVCASITELFPNIDIFVHVADDDALNSALPPDFKGSVQKTFIQKLPAAKKHYQKYLPLMPIALEQLDLTSYDLVVSSESGPAKGIITRPDAVHICYCHSPMRYVWDMYHEYRNSAGRLIKLLFPFIAHRLRMWDRLSADRVDHFIANSSFVASRIRKFYRRESEVVFPPVNVSEFSAEEPREEFYLSLGQLVSYKRADLAVEAFNRLNLPLVVVGEGELHKELRAKAGPNIEVMGRQPFDVIQDLLQRCKGLIFPGVEDFGIVPVEAMASGAPVIAYAKGGALETVIDGETGIHFHEQTVEALMDAVGKLERGQVAFDPKALRSHAEKFSKERFKQQIQQFIDERFKEGN